MTRYITTAAQRRELRLDAGVDPATELGFEEVDLAQVRGATVVVMRCADVEFESAAVGVPAASFAVPKPRKSNRLGLPSFSLSMNTQTPAAAIAHTAPARTWTQCQIRTPSPSRPGMAATSTCPPWCWWSPA